MVAHAAPSNTATDRQVLVVGEGVGGLTTAAFLSQGGLSPVVVTPHECEQASTRPLVLYSSALALFSTVGVADDILASATPIRQWTLRCLDDSRTERLTSAHDAQWPVATVDPTQLRATLRTRIPAGNIRLSKTPRTLVPTDGGIDVEFTDGVREQFDVVVGADGPRSWVRTARFEDDAPERWGTTTWTLRVDDQLTTSETVTELWSRDGVLAVGPALGHGGTRFVTATVDERAPDTARRLLSDSLPLVGPSDRDEPGGVTVVDGHVDYGVSTERWVAGETALVGPAARSFPPVLSLVPSLTVADAYVLADELVNADSAAGALGRYARRRRGRHRALARHVPFDQIAPDRTADGPVDEWYSLRAAVLRTFFAERVPAVSDAAARFV